MKRKLIYYIAVFFIIPLTWSCEKIIDIDIPESDRKIVVNGLINPDSLIKVNISRSLGVLESNEFVYLDQANVSLSKDGEDLGQLTLMGDGFFYLPNHYPEAGSTYHLTVESDGLQTVSSEAVLLDPIEFSEIDTSSTSDEFFGGRYKLSFEFADPHGANYYALAVTATHKVFDYETMSYLDSTTTYPVYFDFSDDMEGPQSGFVDQGGLTYYGSKVYFSDEFFSSKIRPIDIEMSKYSFFDADTVRLDVSLEHVSAPYYLYAVSSGKYDQTGGNPFAEPVSVYTNVENGLGIFGGYSFFRRSLYLVVEGDR